MASSPAQLLAQDLPLLPGQALLQEWGRVPPSMEGYSSCSPTPSTDSWSLSPLYPLCPAPQEPCSSCPAAPSLVLTPRCRAGLCPAYGSRKGSRGRAGGGQRQSASEREKLRMRNLSKALHTLRRYLPPSVAPAGQSLTKIETLRLAIRYISHLSELLGLSEETLAQRREGPRRHCQLCPEGLGCCQARTPGLRAASPAPWEGSPPFASSPWAAPPQRQVPPAPETALVLLSEETARPEGNLAHISPHSPKDLVHPSQGPWLSCLLGPQGQGLYLAPGPKHPQTWSASAPHPPRALAGGAVERCQLGWG
uniref:BHLH domain-containing protein n=1 Tax=Gopherus agassizii TaxID=38772 RepID=A0A452HKL6_9SAUR